MAIVIFIAFSIFILLRTFRLFDELKRSQAIFAEYNVSPTPVNRAISLLPFSLVVYVLLSFLLGSLITSIVALLFFIPALLVSRKQQAIFELAGTDRVSAVKTSLGKVFSTALIGVLYFALSIVYNLFVIGLMSNSPAS